MNREKFASIRQDLFERFGQVGGVLHLRKIYGYNYTSGGALHDAREVVRGSKCIQGKVDDTDNVTLKWNPLIKEQFYKESGCELCVRRNPCERYQKAFEKFVSKTD